MRVLRGVAVTGEMLRRRRDADPFAPAHPRRRERRDARGIVAERARADDRIARIGVHVADRRVVHEDAVGAQALSDRARRALRVRGIAGRADGHRARERRAVADADDGSALLIDRDGHRRQASAPRGVLYLTQHRAELRLRADVAAEGEKQDAADRSALDRIEQRTRRLRPVEAGPHQRAGAELHARRRR